MKFLSKILIAAVSALAGVSAFAQGQSVSAVLKDGSNGDPVAYATVSLTPDGAQKAVKYVLTNDEGAVKIDGVRKGKYTFKAELLGYQPYTKTVTVGSGNVDLGTLSIEPDMKMLEAAKVTDVGNPITIKKDTIEYNATIFKSSDNDMLIDLLQKLPGVEVGSDGSITANGKTISKITIDGKTFFLDDPQLATKNIPSKIIEKVKVVDRKSEQARFTGIDDGEEETIIDLGIKKGMMKGMFGNVMGGGGHDVPSQYNSMSDWRYQGAGFLGNFKDHQQISVILNGNNTNNRGFNDLAGSMMGNNMGGRGRGSWGNNSGITTSWMGGVNGAWDLLDNRMELAGNYLYNGSIQNVTEDGVKNTYIDDSQTLNYLTNSRNTNFSNGHRMGVRLDHKFSDNTSILFEPQFNIGNGNYTSAQDFSTNRTYTGSDDITQVNKGYTNNSGVNDNWTASGRFLLRQRLGKPGRTLTWNTRYSFSKNTTDGTIDNETDTYSDDGGTLPDEYVHQYFTSVQNSSSVRTGVTYTEPVYKNNLFLEANYQYNWTNQNSWKNTFNRYKDDMSEYTQEEIDMGENKDDTYSNTINNTSHNHRAGMNLMYQKDGLSVQLGANVNPTTTHNVTKSSGNPVDTTYTTIRWSPQMSIRYELGENSNLRFNYWGRSNQPSTTQLIPVPDNSDPLNVSLGNPYLEPYFNHTIRGMYRYTNKKTFTSVNAFMDGGITQSPIVNTSWYESDGRHFALPVNGPDSYNASARIMVNSPLGKSKFTIFNMFFIRYNRNSNYQKTGSTLNMDNYYADGNFDYRRFHEEVVQTGLWNENFTVNINRALTVTERFRLTFRNDFVELNAGLRETVNKGWYSISQANMNTTYNTTVDGSMNWTIPGGINLIADYSYNRYDGYTTSQRDAHVLNAEITKLLFKNTVTLALKGYDLLGMSRNLSVADTANYHSETVNNTLGRYIILSLTYRFGTFNKSMMPGPGGGRGPGGPGGPGFGGPRG